MTVLIISGLIVGLSLGLSGGGGSIFALPLLVYGAGVPVHQAIVISLIVVGTTAFVGALQRIRSFEIDFKAALVMILMSVIFAPCGAIISLKIPGSWLMIGFATLMFIVGTSLWIKTSRDKNQFPHHPHGKHLFSLILGAALTSFLNGLFGVGGGFLIVPTLVFAASLNIKRAMATSLLVIGCVSFISTITHLMEEQSLQVYTTEVFLAGGIVGVTFGINLAKNIKEDTLQKGFSLMIICVGAFILLRELFGIS
ncbi:MAG: sulfite exporter TauE/SafE family protein [Chlamydiota bacterium]